MNFGTAGSTTTWESSLCSSRAAEFREGFDLLLVSDASASLSVDPRTVKRMIKPGHRILRLVNVATDQIRGQRSRAVVAQFRRTQNSGAYFRIGNTVEQIYSAAGRSAPERRLPEWRGCGARGDVSHHLAAPHACRSLHGSANTDLRLRTQPWRHACPTISLIGSSREDRSGRLWTLALSV